MKGDTVGGGNSSGNRPYVGKDRLGQVTETRKENRFSLA